MWRNLAAVSAVPHGSRQGDLAAQCHDRGSAPENRSAPTPLRRDSLWFAVLNIDQIETEGGDFGQVRLHHIRIVPAGIEPASSV